MMVKLTRAPDNLRNKRGFVNAEKKLPSHRKRECRLQSESCITNIEHCGFFDLCDPTKCSLWFKFIDISYKM